MNSKHQNMINVLNLELIPAMGCTEPIAIAYGAAVARDTLGEEPKKIEVTCSGNIIKNVKGVTVPTTEDMKGIETSAILGAIAGQKDKNLEVLKDVKEKDILRTKELLKERICKVNLAENVENLYIKIKVTSKEDTAVVVLENSHTNIVEIIKNEKVIYSQKHVCENKNEEWCDFKLKEIYDFAKNGDIKELEALLDKQLKYNTAIAKEGIENNYGASIGKVILENSEKAIATDIKGYTAAASDARMAGCILPVVINSGSGNQGLTASIPIAIYGEKMKLPKEEIYRALVMSNLIAIYIKRGIGKLSAYCGVVGASCGAMAGLCFLQRAEYTVIENTIINALGTISGMVCDGAKASCAAKIVAALDCAFLGKAMAEKGTRFSEKEGIVGETVDETICNIWRLAKVGMKETDIEILKMMIDS